MPTCPVEALSWFRIHLALERDGWHVENDLKYLRLRGGGQHYVLDAVNGAIVSKR